MAESGQLNILIETGADFVLPFTIYDNNKDPVDLTGSVITSHLRRFPEASEYLEFICTHNGAGGRVYITMPKEVTSQIAFLRGVYDVLVTLADGITSYPINGNAEIRHGVTKPYNGSMMYMLGFDTIYDLPDVGMTNRIYFVYDTMEYYRWNGMNYILTGMAALKSVEKIGTEGLVDIYRMTFEDGRYFDYQITNGRGITNVEKISSSGDYASGIVDTYRMTFNDGTTYDYEIRNGKVVFALFDLDPDTGHLMMTSPSYYEGPGFILDDDTGHLYLALEE